MESEKRFYKTVLVLVKTEPILF